MALSGLKFEKLPRSAQWAVLGCFAVALTSVFYLFYLKDALHQRDSLQKEVDKLEISVAQGKAMEGQLARFKQELAQLEERLIVLRSILPAEKETPMILRSIQQMASSSNLKILKFTPQPLKPHEFHVTWPIMLEVEGNYDGLGRFFEKVSEATRIINADDITIRGAENSTDPGKTLSAVCTATTFVFNEDQVPATESNP
jgi:Tfp pilus assembly protein PilO